MMDQPNFYSIIPANVRYDKRLKANEKLLYGEITALTNVKGYCYACNGYFAELYDCSIETISRWISNLKKCKYIHIEMGENGENRKLFISDSASANTTDPLTKTSSPLDEKIKPPLDEKIKHNNTSINTKLNILDFWNSKKIINHKELTPDIDKALDKVILKIGIEKINLVIDRYAKAYHDNNFYFKHKWTLYKFLKQGNGYTEWLDDGGMWNNYTPKGNTGQPQTSVSAVPNVQSTDDYLENIKRLRGEIQ